MNDNPLLDLKRLGQSIWLDYIERGLLENGGLQSLIDKDGITGVTSNPSIFHQAIAKTGQYKQAISALADNNATANEIYFDLVINDIRAAADILRPVYDEAAGTDGYVSLEVSPHLAHDTRASIEQGRWLWNQVGRQNLMIKIPGTLAGLEAIEQLIFEGININVTLLFSVERYCQVLDAYMRGLERRVRENAAVNTVASVASFFLSRIDSSVDAELEAKSVDAGQQGRAAIACAKSAYDEFNKILSSDRWLALSKAGAQPQKLLWASTSTKNPAFSDILYVENLIGPLTVNTLPPKTLDAYRDHGSPELRINSDAEAYRESLALLRENGIDIAEVAQSLEVDGLEKFVASFDALMESLESERRQLRSA